MENIIVRKTSMIFRFIQIKFFNSGCKIIEKKSKNTDYGEAWRDMRISSYTDLILTKIQRTKEIENHNGKTLVSEGIDANYQDMINYSVFALIKHNEGVDS